MKQNEHPFFTVITPNYNTEKFLEQCLSSVAKQTFESYEHIVVNDASPNRDNYTDYESIVDTVSSDYPTYSNKYSLINHQENQGVSTARNKAIDQAHGEFLIFLDADDYLESDFLKNLHYELESDKESWNHTVYNQYNLTAFDSDSGQKLDIPVVEQKPKSPTISKELVFFSITNPALVINKACLGKVRYTTGIQYGEEPDLVFKLFKQHGRDLKIARLETRGYIYRKHSSQFSTTNPGAMYNNYKKILHETKALDWDLIERLVLELSIYRYSLYQQSNVLASLAAKPLTLLSKILVGWWS